MKSLFIDTNVLIDFLTCRDDYKSAALLLSEAKAGKYKVCTSVLSMANIAYILRKVLRGNVLYDTFDKLSFIEISPMTDNNYQNALALRCNDFEDALQYYSALSYGCDYLITRNIKDFPFAKIPVVSPFDFIKSVSF